VQPDQSNITEAAEAGYTMIALGLDNTLLTSAASAVLSMAQGIHYL
jgi:hypothetical protein